MRESVLRSFAVLRGVVYAVGFIAFFHVFVLVYEELPWHSTKRSLPAFESS